MATVFEAQVGRSAVLIAAAEGSLKATDMVEHSLSVRNRGIPKKFMEDFKGVGTAGRHTSGTSHASTKKSLAWTTSSKEPGSKSDSKPAFAKKQQQSPPSHAK